MTRLERLAPSATSLAAALGDTIAYYGGDYFLLNAQRSLWNSRRDGALTVASAARAADALRMLVAETSDARARPLLERALAVVDLLRGVRWRPGYIAEVTTPALDRGSLDRWMGTYTLHVYIMGDYVGVRDIRDREEAIGALAGAVRAKWGPT